MAMARRTLILTVILIFSVSFCFGLDFKALHTKADNLNLTAALRNADKEPRSSEALYLLGLVCLDQHKDKEAVVAFKKIQSLNPQAYEAEWGTAEVLRRQHRIGESEEMLERIIKNHPDFYPAYNSLAYIRYRQLRFADALRLANAVYAAGQGNVDLSNYVRSLVLMSAARGMLAHYGGPISKIIDGLAVLPLLKKAEGLQPRSPAVLFGLGSFYMLAPGFAGADQEKAEFYLKEAINADPNFPDFYARLAQLYRIKGDNPKYEGCIKKALELDPQNELALDIKNGKCRFICSGRND